MAEQGVAPLGQGGGGVLPGPVGGFDPLFLLASLVVTLGQQAGEGGIGQLGV